MKYTFLIISSFFFITLTGSKCKKDKPISPADQLPPATQTGANTFGCLINGGVFLPKGPSLGPILQCAYQYLNTDYSKGYFFQLTASHKNNNGDIVGIAIFSDSLEISEGSFILSDNKNGNATAQYSQFTDTGNTVIYSKETLPGELTITKFDQINQIVSGTFWFNVVKNAGDTIKITDGRFDMQFTK
ncbi:MAG: DUF6252 family protein [Ginsengibacter sp.]